MPKVETRLTLREVRNNASGKTHWVIASGAWLGSKTLCGIPLDQYELHRTDDKVDCSRCKRIKTKKG